MRTTTIRVTTETRDRLHALARRRGAKTGELVAALVAEADERALLDDAEQDWQRLHADAGRFAAYRAETSELEGFEPPLPEY